MTIIKIFKEFCNIVDLDFFFSKICSKHKLRKSAQHSAKHMGERWTRWTKQNMYGFLTVLDYNSFCKYVLSIKSQSLI